MRDAYEQKLAAEFNGDKQALKEINARIKEIENLPIVENHARNYPRIKTEQEEMDEEAKKILDDFNRIRNEEKLDDKEDSPRVKTTEIQPDEEDELEEYPELPRDPSARLTVPEVIKRAGLENQHPTDAGSLHVETLPQDDDSELTTVKLNGNINKTRGKTSNTISNLAKMAKELGGSYNSRNRTFNFKDPEDADTFSEASQQYLDNGYQSLKPEKVKPEQVQDEESEPVEEESTPEDVDNLNQSLNNAKDFISEQRKQSKDDPNVNAVLDHMENLLDNPEAVNRNNPKQAQQDIQSLMKEAGDLIDRIGRDNYINEVERPRNPNDSGTVYTRDNGFNFDVIGRESIRDILKKLGLSRHPADAGTLHVEIDEENPRLARIEGKRDSKARKEEAKPGLNKIARYIGGEYNPKIRAFEFLDPADTKQFRDVGYYYLDNEEIDETSPRIIDPEEEKRQLVRDWIDKTTKKFTGREIRKYSPQNISKLEGEPQKFEDLPNIKERKENLDAGIVLDMKQPRIMDKFKGTGTRKKRIPDATPESTPEDWIEATKKADEESDNEPAEKTSETEEVDENQDLQSKKKKNAPDKFRGSATRKKKIPDVTDESDNEVPENEKGTSVSDGSAKNPSVALTDNTLVPADDNKGEDVAGSAHAKTNVPSERSLPQSESLEKISDFKIDKRTFKDFIKQFSETTADDFRKTLSKNNKRKEIERLAMDSDNKLSLSNPRSRFSKWLINGEEVTESEAAYFNYLRYISGGEYIKATILDFMIPKSSKKADISAVPYFLDSVKFNDKDNSHLKPLFEARLKELGSSNLEEVNLDKLIKDSTQSEQARYELEKIWALDSNTALAGVLGRHTKTIQENGEILQRDISLMRQDVETILKDKELRQLDKIKIFESRLNDLIEKQKKIDLGHGREKSEDATKSQISTLSQTEKFKLNAYKQLKPVEEQIAEYKANAGIDENEEIQESSKPVDDTKTMQDSSNEEESDSDDVKNEMQKKLDEADLTDSERKDLQNLLEKISSNKNLKPAVKISSFEHQLKKVLKKKKSDKPVETSNYDETVDYSKSTDGKDITLFSDNNKKYNAKYKVVSAKELITSHELNGSSYLTNKNYPQELQPRDRERATMQTEVSSMAGDIIPEQITSSLNLNQGAPVVRSDGVVLNGNGRTLALITAYKRNLADNYKKYLIEHSDEFGIDKADIEKIDQPILVREITDELTDEEIQDVINSTTGGSRLGSSEKAVNDSKKLKLADLQGYEENETGDLTTAGNRQYAWNIANKIIPAKEMNEYTTKIGELNADGYQRVKRALFSVAYEDPGLIEKMAQSTDDIIKNVSNALMYAAPQIAHTQLSINEGHSENYPLSETISAAVKLYENAKREGGPIELIIQRNEFAFFDKESDETMKILEIMEQNKRKPKLLGKFFSTMAKYIEKQGDPNRVSLFDDQSTSKLSFQEILHQSYRITFEKDLQTKQSEINTARVNDATSNNKQMADLAKQLGAVEIHGKIKFHDPVMEQRFLEVLDSPYGINIAYHGTAANFDSFSVDSIGAGEGTQFQGWGLYFAQQEQTSKYYRARE